MRLSSDSSVTHAASAEPDDGTVARGGLPRRAWVGAVIVIGYILVAVFAPLLSPYAPLALDPTHALAPPSFEHLLGTDELGRDVLSRLLYATRVDLMVGILGALLPALLGTALGIIAAYRGGWLDSVIMRTADVGQAFPTYVLIIALVFILGQGIVSILVAFTIAAWVIYARLMRGEALRVCSLDYIDAARSAGLPGHRILWRHILPNSIGQTLVYLPSDIVIATIGLAGLSFLGFGIPDPAPEWGKMVADGLVFIRAQWWLSTVPGLVVVGFGLGLSLFAEGIEEWSHR